MRKKTKYKCLLCKKIYKDGNISKGMEYCSDCLSDSFLEGFFFEEREPTDNDYKTFFDAAMQVMQSNEMQITNDDTLRIFKMFGEMYNK
jgi:hypothetical protein